MTLRLGDTLIAGSGANTDLSNLTSQGQNIANWSSNVTNCITEIPQDIKLELNNGTLTLKAGSKVYVPNGAGVFDVVTISSDLTASTSGTASKLLFYNRTTNALDHWNTGDCKSGTSWSGVEGVFYNTSTNTIKYTVNSGSTWNAEYSLPIGIATTDGGFTSINQVFNGFGYIGSTVYVLPNVKGLIPDGRNADGSLKNNEITINNVLTRTAVASGTLALFLNPTNTGLFLPPISQVVYDEINNITTNSVTGERYYSPQLATFNNSGGVITSFTPKTPFHALDYNDSSTISGWSMPSSRYIDLTLGASGTTYTAPANGYISMVMAGTVSGNMGYFAQLYDNGVEIRRFGDQSTSGAYHVFTLNFEIRKGQTFNLSYYGSTPNFFRFVYAEGENV